MDYDTYSLYYAIEQNNRDNKYIRISEPNNASKDIVKGNNIVC